MKTNKKTTPSSYAVHIISIPEGGAIKDNATGEMEKGNTTVFYFFLLRCCRTGARGVLIQNKKHGN